MHRETARRRATLQQINRTNMRQRIFYLFVLAMLLVSCSGGKVKYRIGISQCSADIWRDKQNAELRMGAYFHDNVELKFAAAYDSDERQVQATNGRCSRLTAWSIAVSTCSLWPRIRCRPSLPPSTGPTTRAFPSSSSSARPVHRNIPPLSVPTTTRWGASWANTSLRDFTDRVM